MSSIYQINILGNDQPGQIAVLTRTLSQYQVNILDISQAVIHKRASVALLIEIREDPVASSVLKDILFETHNLGLSCQFTSISPEQYEGWVQAQRKKRYIITLLGRNVTAEHIAHLTRLVAENGLNIHYINRLSARKSTYHTQGDRSVTCIEMEIRGDPHDFKSLRSQFLSISQEFEVDIGLQEDTPYRRHRRLIAFDMDSTLIQTEVIDELASAGGVGHEVAQITESAMRGEIDFKQSLERRVALLAGIDRSVLERIASDLPLTEGAERLIQNLKVLGYKVAIISGGFTFFGKYLQDRLNIDVLYANELDIEKNVVTGTIRGDIIDGQKKAELLNELAMQENISLEQVIAVGDGANDLPMLNLAGLGIAFHAKPIVRLGAKQAISNVGLDAILYFIGLRDRDAAT
jgi:phosphoserine phosphatase